MLREEESSTKSESMCCGATKANEEGFESEQKSKSLGNLASIISERRSDIKKARTWKQPRCPSADEWIRKLWYIYTMEHYSAIKKNTFESVLMRWMKLEPIIQSEVSQKEKHQYSILMHIYGF